MQASVQTAHSSKSDTSALVTMRYCQAGVQTAHSSKSDTSALVTMRCMALYCQADVQATQLAIKVTHRH